MAENMTEISTQLTNNILTITMQRADKKNALTRNMYQQMADALVAANHDDECRAVIIQGDQGCFTSGNDLSDFVASKGHENVVEIVAFMEALLTCEKVVIAKVEGLAVGIGTTMLLHCDLVYCSAETKFMLPFINLGLVPEYASSYLLPLVAGRRKASEWLLLGEPFDAQQAQDYGVVTAVIEQSSLQQHVLDVATKLAQKPAFALRQSKALMNQDNETIRTIINTELDIFIEALETDAAQEAFNAFLERRPLNRDIYK